MHKLVAFLMVFISVCAFSQENTASLTPFYKNRLYTTRKNYEPYAGSSFYPITQSQYNLESKIADSSKQYYTITEILFKKHLLEFKGADYYLTISPIIDFTYSRDLNDTLNHKLFQNTRGFSIEGDLFKNFSFSTRFYENQSRNSAYEQSYYRMRGEQYPKGQNYATDNAVVPGGGRTKPFKGDGFDYASAVGNIVYHPIKKLLLVAGNDQQFIGDGYRSLLLSDNSYSSPYYKAIYSISSKWEFNYYRTRHLNLIRKPISSTVESYYEAKGYAVNYLSYKPTNKVSISLFEGTHYFRDDSIRSNKSHPLYYNPIPLISTFALSDTVANSIIGLNASYQLNATFRFYGQLALNAKKEKVGVQIGTRIIEPFKKENLFFQIEYNTVPDGLYNASLSRLNYSHYNLPLAHTKGSGFNEVLLIANYDWNRLFIENKSVYYQLTNYSSTVLMPIEKTTTTYTGSLLNNKVTLGYRFNPKMNLVLFGAWTYRTSTDLNPSTNLFSVGLKTAITNNYSDF